MAAAGGADVLARNVRRHAAGDQQQILLEGHFHPLVLAHGIRIRQIERFGRPGERVERIADDLAQHFPARGELAFGRDHGGDAAVVRGARLLHVGDGDQADGVAPFGRAAG